MKKIKKIRMVAKRLNLFKGSTFTKAFSHLFPTTWIKKLTKKQRFYLYVLLGSLLVVLIPLAITTFQNPKKSEAAWMSGDWAYRQRIELTNAGSNQTDYQLPITYDTATPITAGKMLSNKCILRARP